jgi:large subunit ribosomal protein L21
MYAIFQDGGKQYRVEKGATIELERKDVKEKASVEFTEVLMVADGDKVKVGTPLLKGAKVIAEVVIPEEKGDKIIAYKFRRREGYHRAIGHRQRHTVVKITDIVS